MALLRTAGAARAAIAAPVSVIARLAESLSYRRQELLVLALLAGSVLGGFAIDAWHRKAPGPLDRLEVEPPRLAALSRFPGPRARTGPGTSGASRAGPAPPAAEVAPATPAPPLDLNEASAGELARLPGIGPRLAARIVARRSQLGGRFASSDELARVPGIGARKAELVAPLVRVTGERAGAPANGRDVPLARDPPPPEPEAPPDMPTEPAVSDPP